MQQDRDFICGLTLRASQRRENISLAAGRRCPDMVALCVKATRDMSIAGQLILLHVVIASVLAVCVVRIRSRPFDDLTYDARMISPLRRFLMPGKLSDRELWRKQQKFIWWFALAFCVVVYAVAMIKILHEPSP